MRYLILVTAYDLNEFPAMATRAQWAKLLGLSTRTLARYEAKGLRVTRVDQKTVLIARTDLIQFLS